MQDGSQWVPRNAEDDPDEVAEEYDCTWKRPGAHGCGALLRSAHARPAPLSGP